MKLIQSLFILTEYKLQVEKTISFSNKLMAIRKEEQSLCRDIYKMYKVNLLMEWMIFNQLLKKLKVNTKRFTLYVILMNSQKSKKYSNLFQ